MHIHTRSARSTNRAVVIYNFNRLLQLLTIPSFPNIISDENVGRVNKLI